MGLFHRNPHAQRNDHKTILIKKTGLNNIAQKPTSEPKNQLKYASTKACAEIRISESVNQTKRSDWLSKFNNKFNNITERHCLLPRGINLTGFIVSSIAGVIGRDSLQNRRNFFLRFQASGEERESSTSHARRAGRVLYRRAKLALHAHLVLRARLQNAKQQRLFCKLLVDCEWSLNFGDSGEIHARERKWAPARLHAYFAGIANIRDYSQSSYWEHPGRFICGASARHEQAVEGTRKTLEKTRVGAPNNACCAG